METVMLARVYLLHHLGLPSILLAALWDLRRSDANKLLRCSCKVFLLPLAEKPPGGTQLVGRLSPSEHSGIPM